MKRLKYSKRFRKGVSKLSKRQQIHLRARLVIFINNPHDKELDNHPLKGSLKAFRSIDITGDIRAWFTEDNKFYKFARIGTHAELYG